MYIYKFVILVMSITTYLFPKLFLVKGRCILNNCIILDLIFSNVILLNLKAGKIVKNLVKFILFVSSNPTVDYRRF
jgi:hypothetical protein